VKGPHHKGALVSERYEIIDFLGEGGMQFVYRAHDQVLERNVALKTPKNASAEKRFKRSAVVAAKVNHPNVAKTLDYVEEAGRPYLIEELIEGNDLDHALLRRVSCLDPYLAARVFHYLAKGLAAAHHAGVVHRDLKPTNVMVSGAFQLNHIKITDFGIAKMADEELTEAAEGGEASLSMSATAVGALPYMSPEAIDTPRQVKFSTDVWSLGAMMYQLLTGVLPYGSGLRAVRNILEAKPVVFPDFLTENRQFSPLAQQLKEIIAQCLKKDESSRPNADELVRLTSELCYPISVRLEGVVREIRHNAWGFIETTERDVFFHLSSVYGARPAPGDPVLFSKYRGGGAARAHPVIVVQNS
jgi:eukaryotic-like serine/threonine-protein kinase